MTFRQAVSSLIARAGSAERVAAEIGGTFSAVYAWSKGRRSPGPHAREQLAAYAKREGLPDVASAFAKPGRRVVAP